jgi:acyl-CoA thioesterase I
MATVALLVMICGAAELTHAQDKHILFFGDSITAGYGLDPDEAFPAIIQGKIDERGLSYKVTNSGVSGETSAGGLRRIDWVLQQPIDIFVLELGGNDGLRGLDPSATKQNLQGIIEKVSETYPDAEIILAGMEAPPNMGSSYTEEFRQIFAELADENDVRFLPFILEGVAGDPDLNLADGIHPTEEGHRILAENVWEVLEPLL